MYAVLVNCHSNSVIKNFQRNITLHRDTFVGLSDSSDEFFYVNCPRVQIDSNVICKVYVEKPTKERFNFTQNNCNALLPNWNVYIRVPHLKPLNNKYILLINVHNLKKYRNKTGRYEVVNVHKNILIQETTIYIIRRSDCNVVKQSLTNVVVGHSGEIIFTGGENYFDVYYTINDIYPQKPSHIDCEFNICRMRYSFDGKVINGPKKTHVKLDFTERFEDLVPLWATLPSNLAYYSFRGSYKHNRVYQLHNCLPVEVLKPNGSDSYRLSDVSVSNNKVSFCMIANSYERLYSAKCQQYDSKGNFLINFELNKDENVEELSLYNLRDGGFIIVETNTPLLDRLDEGPSKIIHVRSHDKHSLLKVPKNRFSTEIKFLEYDRELCLKFVSYRIESGKKVAVYTIECISK